MHFEEIGIGCGDVEAKLSPVRGALVSTLMVAGKDVLYLDRVSFEDETKNVRGGIPVLFPYAGKLADGIFLPANTKMGQHGFGRNRQWSVIEHKPWSLRMGLSPDEESRRVYPYNFVAEQTCRVLPAGLEIELCILNAGSKPLPVSPGWHPYFSCPAGKKGEVRGDVPGLKPDQFGNDREFDFGLAAPQTGRARFEVPDLGQLELSFSPEMRHMQFWSQPGKDFICLEPFTGPNNTINTERRIEVAPGTAHTFFMRIEVE